MKETLKVYLWGQEIGRLAWHESRKLSFFTYNPEFLKGSLDIAPLTASIHHPSSSYIFHHPTSLFCISTTLEWVDIMTKYPFFFGKLKNSALFFSD